MDFTPSTYHRLLTALKENGYTFITFEEYCNRAREEKCIILRHDVDKKPVKSLALAQIEASLGIHATYYFRIVPESNQPDFIRRIADLGHEIAYHYEDLTICKGDTEKAYESFQKNLAYFSTYYPVKTISMHGSPAGKYDNRDIWNHYDYRDFDIIGEPYFDFLDENVNEPDGSRFYFTDTAGMWDGDKYNVRDKSIGRSSNGKVKVHTTDDLIRFLTTNRNVREVMINTHPQRWTDNKAEWLLEYMTQKAKNIIKRFLVLRTGQ